MADRIRRENPPPIRCGARNRAGQPCKRWAVPGATRCKLHGAHAGRNGREAAKDRHAAARIEALVTSEVSKVMLAAGFPPEVVQMAGGSLPTPDPDEESTPSVTDDDVEDALNHSLARLAENLTAKFQGVAVELAQQQGQAAASRPETIEGEAVDSEPETADPGPSDPDLVAEEIEALERHPTAGRMAEAARLRRSREVVTHHFGDECDPPHADPAARPDPSGQEPETTPTPAPAPPTPSRGPRRDAKGRVVTTLGTTPDQRVGSYRDFH